MLHTVVLRWIALTSLLAVGCGSSPPPEAEEPPPPSRAEVGSLLSLVPPESTLILSASPSQLLAAEPTAHVVRSVFPAARLDRFAVRTGVDLRRLDELILAEHPQGRFAIARGPIDAIFAVREAGQRMAPIESSADAPLYRRAGFLGESRAEVVALSEDVILRVEGTPQLTAAILAIARIPPVARTPAIDGADIEDHADAPIALYAPHPLGLPADTGIGLLLAREERMTASVRPEQDALRIIAEFTGEFPPESHDNFRAFAESIAASDFGAALGARDALPSLRIEAQDDRVRLSATVDPRVLASGLRAMLFAEIVELIDGRESAEMP